MQNSYFYKLTINNPKAKSESEVAQSDSLQPHEM